MSPETKMKEFSVAELARIIKAESLNAKRRTLNAIIAGVSIDSRATQPGDCFFAIKGENSDGHDYVADAFAKGAACAVVGKDTQLTHGTLLIVPDTIKALGDFARQYPAPNEL